MQMKSLESPDAVGNRPITIDDTISHVILNKVPQREREAAMALYWFYYRHSILQRTNRVWCQNRFISGIDSEGNKTEKGLGWGEDKIARTRKTLQSHGLIRVLQKHDDRGRFRSKSYVEVVHYKSRESVELSQWQALAAQKDHEVQELREENENLQAEIKKMQKHIERLVITVSGVLPDTVKSCINACSTTLPINACSTKVTVAGTLRARRQCPKPLDFHGKDKAKDTPQRKLSIALYQIVAPHLKGLPNQLPKRDKDTGKKNWVAWDKEFGQLLKDVSLEDAIEVMTWYRQNYGKEFIPEIQSARSFRLKYLKLLSAIKRQRQDSQRQHPQQDEYQDPQPTEEDMNAPRFEVPQTELKQWEEDRKLMIQDPEAFERLEEQRREQDEKEREEKEKQLMREWLRDERKHKRKTRISV
jgi:hypothetical protein